MKFLAHAILVFAIALLSASTAHASVIQLQPNNLGLVGYWSFDEGTSTKATDFSGNGNIGTLSGSTLPAWTAGKHGKALSFDGSSSYIGVGSTNIPTHAPVTVSVWVKINSKTAQKKVVAEWDDGPAEFEILLTIGGVSNDVPQFLSKQQSGNNIYQATASSINIGSWYHLVGTMDASNNIFIYVNGVQTSGGVYFSNGNTGAAVRIGSGQNGSNTTEPFDGVIDDVRIYNRALSATEVAALYTQGSAKLVQPNNKGLVGYWSFDEGTSTKATDFSGNRNAGTLTNSPTWVNGKHGKALSFDNTSSQYVNVPDPGSGALDFGTGSMSVSAWFKAAQNRGDYRPIVNKWDGASGPQYALIIQTGTGKAWFETYDGTNDPIIISTDTYDDNLWHHAVGVRDKSTGKLYLYVDGASVATPVSDTTDDISGTAPLEIGKLGATHYFGGSIDDVRVYNRALSADEVAGLYGASSATHANTSSANLQTGTTLSSGLVGLWTFDGADLTTTTAIDRSGQGNNGTLVSGPTPTIGKLGQALAFNGSNFVDIGTPSSLDISDNASVCAWVKFPPGFGTGGQGILSKRADGFTTNYSLNFDSSVFRLTYDVGSGFQVLQVNINNFTPLVWTDICGVLKKNGSNTEMFLYKNGNLLSSGSGTGNVIPSFANLYIGKTKVDGELFQGSIDDVRVYNRALSAAEVQQLFLIGK